MSSRPELTSPAVHWPAIPGTDWEITQLVKVTDGDTIRAFRRRVLHDETVRAADGLAFRQLDEIHDDPAQLPIGVALRLVILNTPERGTHGYAEARADLAGWIVTHHLHGLLCCETWPGGGFDRILADLYCPGCGRNETASQAMLRLGWDPYQGSRS